MTRKTIVRALRKGWKFSYNPETLCIYGSHNAGSKVPIVALKNRTLLDRNELGFFIAEALNTAGQLENAIEMLDGRA